MQVNRPGHCQTFENGQSVIMRDYCGQNKRVPGIIYKPTGPVSYCVEVLPGVQWRRHVYQMHDSFISQPPACSIPSWTMSGITSSEITADKPALGIVPTKNSGQNMDSLPDKNRRESVSVPEQCSSQSDNHRYPRHDVHLPC